jgi:hypothetical protein
MARECDSMAPMGNAKPLTSSRCRLSVEWRNSDILCYFHRKKTWPQTANIGYVSLSFLPSLHSQPNSQRNSRKPAAPKITHCNN